METWQTEPGRQSTSVAQSQVARRGAAKTVGFIMGGKIRRRRVARERAERKQVYLFPESIITGQPVIDDGNRRRKNPDPVAVAQMESRMKPLPVQYQGQVFFLPGSGTAAIPHQLPGRGGVPPHCWAARPAGDRVRLSWQKGCEPLPSGGGTGCRPFLPAWRAGSDWSPGPSCGE